MQKTRLYYKLRLVKSISHLTPIWNKWTNMKPRWLKISKVWIGVSSFPPTVIQHWTTNNRSHQNISLALKYKCIVIYLRYELSWTSMKIWFRSLFISWEVFHMNLSKRQYLICEVGRVCAFPVSCIKTSTVWAEHSNSNQNSNNRQDDQSFCKGQEHSQSLLG